MPKTKRSRRIDIRDVRIPGGRFTCSARTTSAPEFRKREAAVRAVLDAGAVDVLARLTSRGPDRLSFGDLLRAVAKGDIDSLRTARVEPTMLGRVADRMRQRKLATRRKGTQKQVEILLKQVESYFGVKRDEQGVLLADVRMEEITTQRCEDFLHGPKDGKRPWSPRTQGVKHAYAKELWSLAIEEEAERAEREVRRPRLRRNPWANVEPAEIVATRVVYLTAEERDTMLDKVARTRLCAFMAVAYHAGLRLGEALNLRPELDVDFDANLLRIQSRPGQWAWQPKTKRGQRDVPINRTLRAILQAHIELGFCGERYFFRTPRFDQPLGSATAYGWWVEAYQMAGLKHGRSEVDAVTYHSGRHTFCSLLVQQGVSPLIVAELVGDKYEEVVETYGHLAPHNLRDAVELLDRRA